MGAAGGRCGAEDRASAEVLWCHCGGLDIGLGWGRDGRGAPDREEGAEGARDIPENKAAEGLGWKPLEDDVLCYGP